MLNYLFALIISSCFAQLSLSSEIIHHHFFSNVLNKEYHYNIYLPDKYRTKRTFPTLYLLHGSNGSENDWVVKGKLKETLDTLITKGEIPPTVVVIPSSDSWWVDGHNGLAQTALMTELLPHIEQSWHVITERKGRLVGGLSAGGYGAINLGLQYPETFAAVAALSPSIYLPHPPNGSSAYQHATFLDTEGNFDYSLWEALSYTAYVADYKAQPLIVPFFINSGDHDCFDIAYHSAIFYQHMREHQPNHTEFRVVSGDHEWSVWKKTLPEALCYIYTYAQWPLMRKKG